MHQPVVMAHGSLLMGIKSTASTFHSSPTSHRFLPTRMDVQKKPDCRVISVVLEEEDHNLSGSGSRYVWVWRSWPRNGSLCNCGSKFRAGTGWQTRWQMQWATVIMFASRAASNLLMQIGVAVELLTDWNPVFTLRKQAPSSLWGFAVSVFLCVCLQKSQQPGGRPATLAEKQPDEMCWIHVWMTRWSARSTNSTLTWITASCCFSLRETHRLLDSAEGHQIWLSGMLDSDWSNVTFCGQIFYIRNCAFQCFPGEIIWMNEWMNEWIMHLYSALLCYFGCCTPKRLQSCGGGGLSSTTNRVQRRSSALTTQYTGGEERES